MSETELVDSNPSALNQGNDHAVTITSLKQDGRDRIDSVRFHFIETLARRAQQRSGPLRRVLDERLAKALAAYRVSVEQAQKDAKCMVARMADRFPDSISVLWALYNAGDYAGLGLQAARLERKAQPGPLADLVSHASRQTSPDPDGDLANMSGNGKHVELKSVRYFRDTWLKLQVDQTVKQALATGPSNAGPLNGHSLILQSLELMRDTSPQYLRQFMAYADTLLWLGQANICIAPPKRKAEKKVGRGGNPWKKTPVRGESR